MNMLRQSALSAVEMVHPLSLLSLLWGPFSTGLPGHLVAPIDRLNAILSLLYLPDRCRTPYLALSRIHAQVGVLNRLVVNQLVG